MINRTVWGRFLLFLACSCVCSRCSVGRSGFEAVRSRSVDTSLSDNHSRCLRNFEIDLKQLGPEYLLARELNTKVKQEEGTAKSVTFVNHSTLFW